VRIVSKHRRAILFVFGVLAVVSMTWGFLRRVGIDPLENLRRTSTETHTEESP
jgi:hypothetical protein